MELKAITAVVGEPAVLDAIPPSPNPPAVDWLLEQYDDVFSEPTRLPPSREVDHRIPLKDE